MLHLTPLLLDTSQAHFLDDQAIGREVGFLPSNSVGRGVAGTVELEGMVSRLRAFLRIESQYQRARRNRTLGLGVAASGLSLLAFLIINQTALASAILAGLLAAIIAGGLIGAGASLRASRLAAARHELAREFYRIGLRVEGDTLLTNNAHPQVFAKC